LQTNCRPFEGNPGFDGENIQLAKKNSCITIDWLAKIRKIDFCGASLAVEAEKRLRGCEALLESYAQRVFELHDENR
jgi:hypothetical protein